MFLFTSNTTEAGVTNNHIRPLSAVSQQVLIFEEPRPYPLPRETVNATITILVGTPDKVKDKMLHITEDK